MKVQNQNGQRGKVFKRNRPFTASLAAKRKLMAQTSVNLSVGLTNNTTQISKGVSNYDQSHLLKNPSMSHGRGSSAATANEMIRSDAVVRHQRTNTALVGRNYGPASQVGSSRLNIGRGTSATRRSKNFGLNTEWNKQNLNEQSFAQIESQTDWRSQRSQSGYIRPQSGTQTFNQSPTHKKELTRHEQIPILQSGESNLKHPSLSHYITQLQTDHIAKKSRMPGLYPFAINKNGSPGARVHLNQSMTNDMPKQQQFLGSFQQSRYEKNESQISSCHPKYGKPNIGSSDEQDFGISGKKIAIKSFIDTIPASQLPPDASNLNGSIRNGVLVENRRRTIILKSANADRQDSNMQFEEVLSEEDRKNFSIVNIQALADPGGLRNDGQNYQALRTFQVTGGADVVPSQGFLVREGDSRLSIESGMEKQSTGTMRVSAIISEQPVQTGIQSPLASAQYLISNKPENPFINDDSPVMSYPIIEEDEIPISVSSGWGPSYRSSRQIQQMEKLANLIEKQQKQIIREQPQILIQEEEISQALSKNQTCQVSEEKIIQANINEYEDKTDSDDLQENGLDNNLCQVIQEEDEIDMLNETYENKQNNLVPDDYLSALDVNYRPRSSQNRVKTQSLIDNIFNQDNENTLENHDEIDIKVRQIQKDNDQNIQVSNEKENVQRRTPISLNELQQITDQVYQKRDMTNYNEHIENMSDMKGLGKNLQKKRKLVKKRKQLEGKKSIFDSFEGSYQNYKIANSRSRPSKTNFMKKAASTRHSRNYQANFVSQDYKILIPGQNDATKIIFSQTQTASNAKLMVRQSRDARKSFKKMKNILGEDPNEIEEAIQARVELKMQQYESEMAQKHKQQEDVKTTNRLSAALRVKNGGQLFHMEKKQTGRKQPKELAILAKRARLNSASRFRQNESDINSKPLIDLDEVGLSLGDYATAYSSNRIPSRLISGNLLNQVVSFGDAQPKITFDNHFQIVQSQIKDQPFRQKQVSSAYLQYQEVKPKNPECNGEFKSIDSIVKPAKPVPFDLAVHSRAPADKKNLRYSKFQDPQPEEEHFAEEIDNSKLFGNKNGFEKNKIQSNKIRHIFKIQTHHAQRRRKHVVNEQTSVQKALAQLPTKQQLTKQEKLDKLGNQEIDYYQPLAGDFYSKFNECFDPMRLKIIMLQKDQANPFGKNPDYLFVKGIDYLNARETELAIKCFEKGVHDKSTHLLCRFNLGYTLFKVGHFQAAVSHYETLTNQCLELGIHPHRFIPSVLYNKTVCELQSGLFLKAAASAAMCIDIIKADQQAAGGNILSIPRKDQELLIDMCQLRGLALFRGGECKLGGQSLEAADVQLAIIEQHEADIALKREQLKINKSQQSNRSSPSNRNQSLHRNDKLDTEQGNEEGIIQQSHRRHASNMNLTIEGFKNLKTQNAATGLGERAGSVALAAVNEEGIKIETVYDGDHTGPSRPLDQSELHNQSRSSTAVQNGGQKLMNQTLKNENVVLKVDSGRTKRSSARLSKNSRSNHGKQRKQSKKKLVAQDFEVLADQANQALDFDNINMKDQMGIGIPNIKKQEEHKYKQIKSYLNDFRERLEASVRAVASGNDEVRAFRDGDKEEGGEVRNDADSDADARNQKKTNRLTYRNTQRGKSKNQLEMEVEKDLTHLKNLLYKKRELKKKFNKEEQIITLEDKAQLKNMMIDLAQQKKIYNRSQPKGPFGDHGCLSLEYPKQIVSHILDLTTKYREVRESYDEKKRQWLLERGVVDYMVMNRGDVLFEQDISQCDAQYIIVGGKVSLIKTFVDHELIYKMKQEARLERTLAGQEPESAQNSSLERSVGPALLDAILEENEPNMAAELSSATSSGESMISEAISSPERSINENEDFGEPPQLNFIPQTSINPPTLQSQEKGQKFGDFLHDLTKVEIEPRKATDDSDDSGESQSEKVSEKDQEEPTPEISPKKEELDFVTQKQTLDQKQIDDILKTNAVVYDYETAAEIDKRGVVVHPVDLQRGEADVKISIVEQSHYQGQFFGNDCYLDWKDLNFNQKMLIEVDVMIADKSAISGYVQDYEKQQEEKQASELADFQKLSIVRQETIKQAMGLSGGLSAGSLSPGKLGSSPNQVVRNSSTKLLDAVNNTSSPGRDAKSPSIKVTKLSMSRKLSKGDSFKSLSSSKQIDEKLNDSPLRLNLAASSEGLQLNRQETEDIEKQIKGYDKAGSQNLARHRSTIVMNQVIGRLGALKADQGSVDSMQEEGPWPLTKLKREHSCLVMEDSTLIIKIPYKLERMYVAHLAKLREEELDH